MMNHNDVQKSLADVAKGDTTADDAMKVVDSYANKRSVAQEVAQTVQVLGSFALIGWIAWLIIAGW